MRGAVMVIATPELGIGFALAGLRTVQVASAREGAEALLARADEEEVGVVLVEESILDALPEAVRTELWRRPYPIIVPFPRPSWVERARPPEDYIMEILQRAIGYRVRLQ